jgi:hypothetical protein
MSNLKRLVASLGLVLLLSLPVLAGEMQTGAVPPPPPPPFTTDGSQDLEAQLTVDSSDFDFISEIGWTLAQAYLLG